MYTSDLCLSLYNTTLESSGEIFMKQSVGKCNTTLYNFLVKSLKLYNITFYIYFFLQGIKEIKLKEFNFKLLHNILLCNKNLAKWRIKTNDRCDVCGQSQTVEHLLYSCIYVKPLRRVTENFLGVDISFERMLGLDVFFAHNAIVTLIGFLIYKEWLLYSLADKHRRSCIDLTLYKNELIMRVKIYKLCKSIDKEFVDQLEALIQEL